MTLRPMDARSVPVTGTLLVEASAGTGKTWTIGALLVRLLMEGRRLPEILILTFTEAATADLRGRMRARLEEALAWLEGLPDAPLDELLADLLDRGVVERGAALDRVRQALAQFDEASIFTIHGFCRRVLGEAGLEAGISGSPELGEGAGEALERVALDQLRVWWDTLPHAFLDWLAATTVGRSGQRLPLVDPAPWMALASQAAEGTPTLEDGEAVPLATAVTRLQQGLADGEALRQAALDEFHRHGAPALASWLAGLRLNGARYPAASQEERLGRVEGWLREGAAAESFPKRTTDGRWYHTLSHVRSVQNKGGPPIDDHPFFSSMDEVEQAMAGVGTARAGLLRALQVEAATTWPARAAALRLAERRLDFHDLLSLVRRALAAEGSGRLKELLRDRWRLAMLDEFQDTDPLQAEIFQRLFREAGLPLVLVGDPKQSIYGFRGADLDAYLKVARTADGQRSLDTNWRSDPPLVEAVNRLFAEERFPAGRGPFLHPEVRFRPVQARPDPDNHAVRLDGRELAAFLVVRSAAEGLSKEGATSLVCRHLSQLVGALLDPDRAAWVARAGGAVLGPVQGRDVAILVRTGRQARQVAQALAEQGISSIQSGRDSVWASDEAEQLVRLLLAVERPDDGGRVRTLLAGGLARALGGDSVASLQDPRLLARVQMDLHRARAAAARLPLATVLERFLDDVRWRQSLLGRPLGERRVVNWTHLLELLRAEERRMPMDPGALARLAQAKRHEAETPEEWEQRLESEDSLVRIATMHKSKGLEYRLVLCPFLWEGVPAGDSFRLERLPAGPDGTGGGHALLTPGLPLDGETQGRLADARLAEALRLAYVALTRARSQLVCYSLHPARRGGSPGPLDWLLFPAAAAELPHPGLGPGWKDLPCGPAEAGPAWSALAEGWTGFGVEELETSLSGWTTVPPDTPGEPPILPCREFHRPLEPREATSSFTSLLRDSHTDERQDEGFGPEAEVEADDEDLMGPEPPGEAGDDFWTRFPAGATAGVCLHTLLEEGLAAGGVSEEACRRELLLAGLDLSHAPALAPRLDAVLRRPLGRGGPLPLEVDPRLRATELAFHMSTEGMPEGTLHDLCRRHGLHDPGRLGVSAPATLAALEQASQRELRPVPGGSLKGYVDLCLCWRDEWWVVDWKSNRLAAEASGYSRERLVRSMAESGYFLQALLYLTALHRHLARVDGSHDAARRLGGLRYVYLRGLRDGDDDGGVFTDRLPLELILELDEAMGRRR